MARVNRTLSSTRGGMVFEAPKTPWSRRPVILPAILAPYLVRQREDQARRRKLTRSRWQEQHLVIDRRGGLAWNPDSFSEAWIRFLRKHRLPSVRFHDLRHAHATLLLLQGIHPKIVSERLGHSSIGITLDTYSHVLPTIQEEAARAFDDLFPSDESG